MKTKEQIEAKINEMKEIMKGGGSELFGVKANSLWGQKEDKVTAGQIRALEWVLKDGI